MINKQKEAIDLVIKAGLGVLFPCSLHTTRVLIKVACVEIQLTEKSDKLLLCLPAMRKGI
jgi:hypothetical protein